MKKRISFTPIYILFILCLFSHIYLISKFNEHWGYFAFWNEILGNKIQQQQYLQYNHDKTTQKTHLCPACNFTPLHPPSSTKRDVVLAAALNSINRAEIFIRTLRMTGSRCRIILFLDSKQSIEPHYLRFFKTCGIEPVFVNNKNDMVLIGGSKMTRYYYYHQWLSKHINEVDRVLHSDTFDVFFQSDPFQDEMLPVFRNDYSIEFMQSIKTNSVQLNIKIDLQSVNPYFNTKNPVFDGSNIIYISIEPVPLHASVYTGIWFSKCYGDLIRKYNTMPVSCSGVTIGHSKAFLTYLNVLFRKSNWTNCFGDSLDQAHHNYILYHNDLQNEGIIVRGLDCNSEILTMHFCCKYAKCHLDETTNIFYGNNSNKAPIIVHQYNRIEALVTRNQAFCPGNAKSMYSNEIADFSNKTNATNHTDLAEIERLPPFDFPMPEKLS